MGINKLHLMATAENHLAKNTDCKDFESYAKERGGKDFVLLGLYYKTMGFSLL